MDKDTVELLVVNLDLLSVGVGGMASMYEDFIDTIIEEYPDISKNQKLVQLGSEIAMMIAGLGIDIQLLKEEGYFHLDKAAESESNNIPERSNKVVYISDFTPKKKK